MRSRQAFEEWWRIAAGTLGVVARVVLPVGFGAAAWSMSMQALHLARPLGGRLVVSHSECSLGSSGTSLQLECQ
ncbi:MAG: hypothetical protein JRF63_10370 [Deltaproteobacteria bacterium]|nr:hypothetical protein [Deltaproteobacteria bacterium]